MKIEGNAVQKIKDQIKEDLLFDYYEKVMKALTELEQYYVEDKLNSEYIYKIVLSLTQAFFDVNKKIDNIDIHFIIGDEEKNED